MNKGFRTMFKKMTNKANRKKMIIFLCALFLAISSPFVYLLFMPKYGRIVYTVDSNRGELRGNFGTIGIHEHTNNMISFIGKSGTQLGEINVDEKLGYKFLEWSDGEKSKTRKDCFVYDNLKIDAFIDYANYDIPNIDIDSEYNNDSKDVAITISTAEQNYKEQIESLFFPYDFENYQGQYKKNFCIFSNNGKFFNKKFYKGFSLFYDKTCLRQLFAIELYNRLFDAHIDFKICNVYFNDVYYGLYVFVDCFDNYCADEGILFNRSNAKSEIGINYKNRNYMLINNDEANRGKIESILEKIYSGAFENYDSSSFIKKCVINILMNNSSQDENDMLFLLKNDKLFVSSLDSYSLSSGLFRYANYSPTSDFSIDGITKKMIDKFDCFEEIETIVRNSINVFDLAISSFFEKYSFLVKSIDLNNEKYPVKSVFSTPLEIQYYNYLEMVNYFKQWLLTRYYYLKDNFSL